MGLLKNAMGHMTSVLFNDGDPILFNGESIIAIVADPEESPGPVQFGPEEPGIMKKVVGVKKEDLPEMPREGDEVELVLDGESDPYYWRVSRVVETWHEYQIHFQRYTG